MQASKFPLIIRSPVLRIVREPLLFGTVCGLASAVGYTAANACLRAVAHCDPVWVSCVKAVPTVVLFGPLLVWRFRTGREGMPAWRQLWALVLAALACQLLGNVVFQWSLGVIGMALAIPLTLGAMIIGAALLGRIFLHEPVTVAMACSLVILVLAAFVLSLGADRVRHSTTRSADHATRHRLPGQTAADATAALPTPARHVVLGVVAACLAGLAYALLGVVIRSVVTDSLSICMTMVTVTLTGVIALGAVSVVTPGLSVMWSTHRWDFSLMLCAGLFNAVAFLALTKSLQLVPVAQVNLLNASQAAMGALAGILLFGERSSGYLWLGVALTAGGLLLMRRPAKRPPR